MKTFGFVLFLLCFSKAGFAAKLDCRDVTTKLYSYRLDGAYVDPIKGIFISYIQDVGGGYELTESRVSAFSHGKFDRLSECTEEKSQSGAITTIIFICQSKTSSFRLKSSLIYNDIKKVWILQRCYQQWIS